MHDTAQFGDFDLTNMGVLFGVVAAAFVALGVIIYVGGDDQSDIAAAYDAPMRTERMLRKRAVQPDIIDWRG